MAKKYHIDVNGDIVECRAKLRGCPRTDYSTIEAASAALFLQKTATDLEAARENVKKVFSNPDTKRMTATTDFSGINPKQTMRDFADKVDNEFYATGKEPEFYSVHSQLKQNNMYYDSSSQKVFIKRIPVPDYDDGVITSKWSLEIEPSSKEYAKKNTKYELDLHNDFDREIVRAEDIIRESVIANSTHYTTSEDVERQTRFLKNQLIDAYFMVEEETQGPQKLWSRIDGYGTFAKSDPAELIVNVDYQHSAFRGKIFERFLNENGHYQALTPEIDVRVYDNETNQSKNSWGVRYHQGQWYVETRVNNEFNHKPVDSGEEAYSYLNSYIKNYMKTNDDATADKKARYASDLITDIDLAVSSFIKKKEVRDAKEEAERIQRESKSLYGKNNSGTMRDILNIFS